MIRIVNNTIATIAVALIMSLFCGSFCFNYGYDVITKYIISVVSISAFILLLLISFKVKILITLTVMDLFVLLYLIYLCFNTFINNIRTSDLQLPLQMFCIYAAFRFISSINFDQSVRLFIMTLIVIGIVQGVIGLLQFISLRSNSSFMITGTFYNSAPFAFFLTLSYCCSLYAIFFSKTSASIRYLSFISIFITLMLLPPTLSRASWGCLLLMTMIMLMRNKNVKPFFISKKYRIVILTCLLLSFILLAFSFKQDSAKGRLFMWHVGLETFSKSPIIGSGIGSYNSSASQTQIEYFQTNFSFDNQHIFIADTPSSSFNGYIDILVEQGVVGFVLFLIIILFTLRALIIGSQYYDAIIFVMLSILFFALTSYLLSLITFAAILTIIIAITASCQQNKSGTLTVSANLILLVMSILSIICVLLSSYKPYKALSLLNEEYIQNPTQQLMNKYQKLYDDNVYNSSSIYKYAFLLNQFGEYKQSNSVLLDGKTMNVEPMFYILVARNYLALHQDDLAVDFFLKAHYLVPSKFYPLHALKEYYFESKDYKNCMDICNQIVLMPEKIKTYNSYLIKEKAKETINLILNERL